MPLAMLALIALGFAEAQEPTPTDPLNHLAFARALSCEISDDRCLQQEFAARRDADQAARIDANLARICPSGNPDLLKLDEACARTVALYIDQDNTRRAKAVLASGQWPGWSGAAARGLWLSVQHSRASDGSFDTPFMVSTLPALRQGVAEGHLDAQDFARTADRALLDSGQLQQYGTIRICRGVEFDMTTSAPAGVVEANRADLGMEITFAQLKPYWDGLCLRDSQVQPTVR